MDNLIIKPAPWYKNPQYWYSLANNYINSATKRINDKLFNAELNVFREFNTARVIFESNQIESAGLPLCETQKIISEYFPKLPSTFDEFFRLQSKFDFNKIVKDGRILPDVYETLKSKGYMPEKYIPIMSMAKKQRPIREVIQHYNAIIESISFSLMYFINFIEYQISLILGDKDIAEENKRDLEEILRTNNPKLKNIRAIPKPKLFSEDIIKRIHKLIASGILPKNSKVPAGTYRIDNRIVGWDIVFPAPELIPDSMKAFIIRSNNIMNRCHKGQCNIYEAAALISYDFVSIHPFPDFNGRISRIIMNMVLLANRCPFPIALKGSKKERHKYFSSLRKANNSKYDALSALIACRVVYTFQELDNHLKKANLPCLLNL